MRDPSNEEEAAALAAASQSLFTPSKLPNLPGVFAEIKETKPLLFKFVGNNNVYYFPVDKIRMVRMIGETEMDITTIDSLYGTSDADTIKRFFDLWEVV